MLKTKIVTWGTLEINCSFDCPHFNEDIPGCAAAKAYLEEDQDQRPLRCQACLDAKVVEEETHD